MRKLAGALPPGSVIGILGGGQLARMLALAAGQIGLKCHIYAPEADSPAFQVTALHTVAGYQDETALAAFAQAVDAVTYEFENVPARCVAFLESLVPVRPNARALGVTQNRIKEKSLAQKLGAKTAAFAEVNCRDDLVKATGRIGYPCVLKTNSMGYDGKGQAKLQSAADIDSAWAAMRDAPAILEAWVSFDCEVSVIAVRGTDGSFASYDIAENEHRNHILYQSKVPARVSPAVAEEARTVARQILTELDYVGVMGIEYFVGSDGLHVNEMAPRVHNSGHWTQNGCVVSQFENHIRAVAGWPLGSTERHSDAVMTNLLGDEVNAWAGLAGEAGVAVHLYGKAEARAGRKMGHINRISPKTSA